MAKIDLDDVLLRLCVLDAGGDIAPGTFRDYLEATWGELIKLEAQLQEKLESQFLDTETHLLEYGWFDPAQVNVKLVLPFCESEDYGTFTSTSAPGGYAWVQCDTTNVSQPSVITPPPPPEPIKKPKLFAEWKCHNLSCPDRAPQEHPVQPVCYTCGDLMERV
jgi:hypothetical protein